MNLLESYKGRLAVSEKYYSQSNGGAKLDMNRKLVTALFLINVSKFMNESFTSNPTKRAAMGEFKKFCLDIK